MYFFSLLTGLTIIIKEAYNLHKHLQKDLNWFERKKNSILPARVQVLYRLLLSLCFSLFLSNSLSVTFEHGIGACDLPW